MDMMIQTPERVAIQKEENENPDEHDEELKKENTSEFANQNCLLQKKQILIHFM